ncbi:MAG: hypothetical protein AMXMBFR58_24490 [Phycisphaerae bacterium]
MTILKDGKSETVRLLGVDTPETKDPRKPIEFFGREAAAFTTNLLTGESVYVIEERPGRRDKYGRMLAHLYRAPDGLWVNLEIVRQGYGVVYSGEAFERIDLFLKYQARAREAGKGLWSPTKNEWERDRQVFPFPEPTTSPVAPAVQPTGEDPKPQTQQATVYVTRNGTNYHAAACVHLKS